MRFGLVRLLHAALDRPEPRGVVGRVADRSTDAVALQSGADVPATKKTSH